jgi:iron complex transport system substrate-binding protein
LKLRKICIAVIILGLLAGLAGCQPQFQPGTYTDDIDRQVDISEVPERIVSFGPSITEILFALGLEDNVVGVSDFCDYPEAAKSKEKIGNAFSPSVEKVVALEPDLVVTVEHEQFNSDLDSLGITFIVLSPGDVRSIVDSISLAAEVTGKAKEGKRLVEDMEATITRVADSVKDATKVKVFFIVDATDPNSPWTAGPGSFIDDIINMAGGENVAASATGDWVQISTEEIVNSDPDIIIIQTMMGGVPTVAKEVLEEHLVWKQMTAVKQDRIYFIDGDIVSRPGPRIVQGLEEMAKIIHPELFE